MQAAEAITRLIAIADLFLKPEGVEEDLSDYSPENRASYEQDQLAISVSQAMLNSMIPVARFRVFIRIESGQFEGAEYTVCCTDILSVRAAVHALRSPARKVYIQLWEQRATGADMLLGFQGSTVGYLKGKRSLDHWLESLSQFDGPPTVQ